MKYVFMTIVTMFSLTTLVNAQQVSLFNNQGEAVAYIDFSEDATIFLWNGTPMAFLEKDGDDICVFGFNGSFLGWYEEGIFYDKKGYVVGAKKGAVNMATKIEEIKGIQKITPIRPITAITPIQPILKNSWSSNSLTEYLYFGNN